MKIGYARVSTEDQNPDLQLVAALKQAGCQRIFTNTAIGVHVKQPELTKCLKTLANSDTLIVWKPDRLGRSLAEAIDTATPTGRATWQMVGILAELERFLIQRTDRSGLPAHASPVAHTRKLIGQGEHHDAVAQSLKAL